MNCPTSLSVAEYKEKRFDTILWLEENGHMSLPPYLDSKGYLTIGIGFKLDSNWDTILTVLGFDVNPPSGSAEEGYIQSLQNAVSTSKNFTGQLSSIINQLNTILTNRANDPSVVSAKPGKAKPTEFKFDDNDEVKEAFGDIVEDRETLLDQWQADLSIERRVPRQSNERLALLSLTYNNIIKPGKATALLQALSDSNRAEAWYEIRYNSNGGESRGPGIAKRRYFESELFGLYDNPDQIGLNEALAAYQMLQTHRSHIASEETLFGSSFDGLRGTWLDENRRTAFESAGQDYLLTLLKDQRIDSLEANLNLAKPKVIEYIKSLHPTDSELEARLNDTNFWFSSIYLNPSKPTDADRSSTLSAEDYEVGLHENGTNDVLVGLDQTDVVYGGKANDVLLGEGGSDTLRGGAGEDYILGGGGVDYIWGGPDDDVLNGGENNDLYYYHRGDGKDRIVDEDGGKVILEYYVGQNAVRETIGTLYRENPSAEVWTSDDGEISFTHNSPWTLGFDDGGSIELGEDFVSGDFGINLIDVPQEVIRPRTIKGSALGDDLQADGTVSATLFGYQGDDSIAGSSSHDAVFGGYGRDWIEGGGGDDRIEGGPDSDFLLGAQGNDRLYTDSEEEMAILVDAGESAAGINERGEVGDGNIGNDFIYGSNRWDALFGGVDSDLIVGGGGDDYLSGDGEILMAFENWWIEVSRLSNPDQYSFIGHDISWIEDGTTGGGDTIYGGTGRDYILGHGGDDELQGGEGDDLIWGHAGDDSVIGGAGNDELQGDAPEWQLGASFHGNDYMDGGDGDDWMWGYAGDDQIFGGRGKDNVLGGDGNDHINGEDGSDRVFGDAGNDYVLGGAGDDWLQGDNRLVNILYHGDDFIDGQEGNDTIFGEGGSDTLYGGSGNDILVGGSSTSEDDGAADILEGGEGHDVYFAGEGDIIYDSDGDAEIYFLGSRLQGGDAVAPPSPSPSTNTYKDKRGTYTRDGTKVTYATTIGHTVVIMNVLPGAYGIQLKGKPELSWLEGLLGEKAPWPQTPLHLRR